MIKTFALLAFLAVTTAQAQTTFVQLRRTEARSEVTITGQAGEAALKELLTLAEKRAFPQKLAEGKAFDFDLGALTKNGKGLRVQLSARAGDLALKRKGTHAILTLNGELAQKLYRLADAVSWATDQSNFYIAISPSRSIQCEEGYDEQIDCKIYLEHVLQ